MNVATARSTIDYTARRSLAQGGYDPDVPEPGYYRFRLRSGAVAVGVHIFYGQTLDPETGEPLERWGWKAAINGERVPVERVWPQCAASPIGKAEHDYLISLQEWGRVHDPDGPQANPTQRVDLLTAPLPF